MTWRRWGCLRAERVTSVAGMPSTAALESSMTVCPTSAVGGRCLAGREVDGPGPEESGAPGQGVPPAPGRGHRAGPGGLGTAVARCAREVSFLLHRPRPVDNEVPSALA
jgi:hypothetical protein